MDRRFRVALFLTLTLLAFKIPHASADLFVSTNGGQVLEYNGTTGAFDTTFASIGNGLVATGLVFRPNTVAVPEHASLTLLVFGAVGALGYAWRRRKQSK